MTFPRSADSVLFPPFDTCPACRVTGLQPLAAGDQALFLCPLCHRYWHIDLGWIHEVRPAARAGRERGDLGDEPAADPGNRAN